MGVVGKGRSMVSSKSGELRRQKSLDLDFILRVAYTRGEQKRARACRWGWCAV